MDSHSTEFEGGLIDAPLRVMNPHLWNNTLSLAAYLGIKTFPVRTYMACSWLFEDRTETWLTTTRSRIGNFPIINNRKGIQQYGWRLVKGMLQLKTAIAKFFKSQNQDITLAEFINRNEIEEVFWHGAVMPVLYTICTCNPKTIGEWPAKPLLVFLRQLTDGDALLRLQGVEQPGAGAVAGQHDVIGRLHHRPCGQHRVADAAQLRHGTGLAVVAGHHGCVELVVAFVGEYGAPAGVEERAVFHDKLQQQCLWQHCYLLSGN